MSKLKIILIQNEKGGTGKTTVGDAVVAGLQAGGAKLVVVDADDGNSGFVRRCGKGSAIPVSWCTGADALPGWLETNLSAGTEVAVVDCGANLIASGAPLNGFLGQWLVDTEACGGSIVALAVASTNAPGTGRLVTQMRDSYGALGQVRLINNDQDGSGAFDRSLAAVGMISALLPHIQPGIFAARLLKVRPLLDMVREPPPHYAAAMVSYAVQVCKFLSGPALADLIAPAAIEHIRSYTASALRGYHYKVGQLEHARDDALACNAAVYEAQRVFQQTAREQRTDDAAVAHAALALFDAGDRYFKSIR